MDGNTDNAYGLKATLGCGQPERQKYWSELDDKEKIERMRIEIKHLGREIDSINGKLNTCYAPLLDHQHGESGAIMVPLKEGIGLLGHEIGVMQKRLMFLSCPEHEDSDKVYF